MSGESYTYAHPHPSVSVDVAVFAEHEEGVDLLLIRRAGEPFRGEWALPGGFVDIDEDLPDAATRELAEETGLEGLELHQIGAFGAPDRDPRERVISVAYWAMTDRARAKPLPASDAAAAEWHALDRLPMLAFDHVEIVAEARRRAGV